MDNRHVHTGIDTRSLHDGIMAVFVQLRIALEPVADDSCASLHVRPDEPANLDSRGVRQDGDACAASNESLIVDALVIGVTAHRPLLDGTDHRDLAASLRPSTVALLLPAAEERLVNLDQVFQLEI